MELNEERWEEREEIMALVRGKKRKQYQGMMTYHQLCYCRIYSQWESLGSVYGRRNSV